MTNERAKEVLQEQIDRYGQEYDAEGIEALEIAIKVLGQTSYKSDARRWKRRYLDLKQRVIKLEEQQPCEDAISRESVIEWLKNKDIIKTKNQEENARRELDALPPVTPWSGWIPATQLPEPNTAVLLYVKYKSSGQWTYLLGMWNGYKKAWEDWRTPYDLEEEFDIIAWMELPEKYEEDKHER